MKRFQIVILTIMLASLSACATNSLPSSSTESSVSISVSNPQDFLSELEDMETGQILEELKISDGGYTEDCFSVLSKRLVEFPEDTLRILKHSKLMTDEKFEELVITGIRSEISYTGSDEEKKALYKYLKSASTGGEYAEMASKILDGWTFEGERIPNHKIEFSAQESEQSNCAISITLPQGWKFQEKTKKSDTEHEPLMLAGLNPLYTVYDIYDSDHTLIGAIGYSNYEPYEGDKDSVQVVYSALRLGSVYRFDTDSRYGVVTKWIPCVLFRLLSKPCPMRVLRIFNYASYTIFFHLVSRNWCMNWCKFREWIGVNSLEIEKRIGVNLDTLFFVL